jgi:phosphonate degradation associated HDIG domain protein
VSASARERRDVIGEIFRRFASYGAEAYLGEPVTLSAHMLQTAAAAEREAAGDELVAAGLLHDFGHLIAADDSAADRGVDTEHEELSWDFLSAHFPPEVVEPVRLHVAAKRYLCAVDPAYLDVLSAASRLSLDLQGGPMSAEEVAAFETSPHAERACRLRRFDDEAKDPGASTPPLDHYRPVLERVLLS